MGHDAAESALGMAIFIDLSFLIHVYNPVVPPFLIVQAPVVGAIGDQRVLGSGIIAVRTPGQETERYAIAVCLKRMGEAADRVLRTLLAAALRRVRVCEEDTVLGGQIDVVGGVLFVTLESLDF